jgi:hypothetical protein
MAHSVSGHVKGLKQATRDLGMVASTLVTVCLVVGMTTHRSLPIQLIAITGLFVLAVSVPSMMLLVGHRAEAFAVATFRTRCVDAVSLGTALVAVYLDQMLYLAWSVVVIGVIAFVIDAAVTRRRRRRS